MWLQIRTTRGKERAMASSRTECFQSTGQRPNFFFKKTTLQKMSGLSLHTSDYQQNVTLIDAGLNHTQIMDPDLERLSILEHACSTIFGGVGISVTCFILYVFKKMRRIAPTEILVVGLLTTQLLYNVCYIGVMTFITVSYEASFLPGNGVCIKIFNSVNYFLFAFCVISSYVLLFALTVCRYYAVCHFEKFRYCFSRRRCNRYMMIACGVGFFQGSLNASYEWVPRWAQLTEDILFGVVLTFFLIFNSTVMAMAYRKIMDRIECVHQKLSPTTTAVTQILDTRRQHQTEEPTIAPPQKSRSKSLSAATVTIKHQPKVEFSINRNPSMIASSSTKENNQSNRRAMFAPTNNHYSKQISGSLLCIKVLFIICVTPWTLNFIARSFLGIGNIYVNVFCNLLLQLNYVLSPIVYLCRNATLKTKAAVVCGWSAPKPKPGRGCVTEK